MNILKKETPPITFTAIIKDEKESQWVWDSFRSHTLNEPTATNGLQIINVGEGDCVRELEALKKKYYDLEERLENTIKALESAIEDINEKA
jgi:hypothetical protein